MPETDPQAGTGTEPPANPPAQPPADPPAQPANPPADDGDELSKLDPAELAKMVRDLRRENGAARTTAKQQAAAEAAEQAKRELAQTIGKAIGLVEDEVDPEKLTADLTAAQQRERERAVELAIWQNASTHGADPKALTDSRGFMTAVHKLDPGSDDFATQVDAAIKAAVESNTKLRAAQAAPTPRSGGEFTGGSGGAPTRPKSLSAAVRGKYAQ